MHRILKSTYAEQGVRRGDSEKGVQASSSDMTKKLDRALQ